MSKYGTEPYDPHAAYGTGALTEPNSVRTLRVLVLALLVLSLASYALMTVWMLSDAYLDGVLAMYEDFGLPADEAEAAADSAGELQVPSSPPH
ncbi:hypothetical protein [Nesterenkonia pannonica]|uniref:hypothetical protein n=1 Tax=Nesterenkonia pannonica TaxID=1548602 RepID=UPI002164EC31|nr:hypothetical protein [Nesterenkonia pannonica]